MFTWIDGYHYAQTLHEDRLREAAQSRQAAGLARTSHMLLGRLAGLRALLRRSLWGGRRHMASVRPQFGLHAR
jgi:hypothetical protein